MCSKQPKKTLTSKRIRPATCHPRQWSRRNDSSSVFSLLAPDDLSNSSGESSEDEEPRRPLLLSKTKKPHTSMPRACPSCYCNGRPVAPLLPSKSGPDQCMCPEEGPPEYPPAPCRDTEVHSVFLRYSPQSRRRIAHDKYTRRRRNYENATSSYFVDLKERLAQLEEELCDEVSTVETQYKHLPRERPKITPELTDFRRKHFFCCHGSGVDLQRVIPEHSCQHDFTLNSRLQPVPKHPDVNGLSRCTTCNKPPSVLSMELDHPSPNMSAAVTTSTFNTSKPSSSPNSWRHSEVSLMSGSRSGRKTGSSKDGGNAASTPQRLSFAVGREVFNIDVPRGLGHDVKTTRRKKPVPPANSMALRFQKGVY